MCLEIYTCGCVYNECVNTNTHTHNFTTLLYTSLPAPKIEFPKHRHYGGYNYYPPVNKREGVDLPKIEQKRHEIIAWLGRPRHSPGTNGLQLSNPCTLQKLKEKNDFRNLRRGNREFGKFFCLYKNTGAALDGHWGDTRDVFGPIL